LPSSPSYDDHRLRASCHSLRSLRSYYHTTIVRAPLCPCHPPSLPVHAPCPCDLPSLPGRPLIRLLPVSENDTHQRTERTRSSASSVSAIGGSSVALDGGAQRWRPVASILALLPVFAAAAPVVVVNVVVFVSCLPRHCSWRLLPPPSCRSENRGAQVGRSTWLVRLRQPHKSLWGISRTTRRSPTSMTLSPPTGTWMGTALTGGCSR
jgi:hypothetical protein